MRHDSVALVVQLDGILSAAPIGAELVGVTAAEEFDSPAALARPLRIASLKDGHVVAGGWVGVG